VIAPLEAAYDVVFVDTGAGLGHEALVATGLADGTVLVTTPDDAAVCDVAKTAEFVDDGDATVLGAVVTRTGAETDLGAIAERLGVPLLGAIPEDSTVGTEPATTGDAGRAYRSLAATLLTATDDAPGVGLDAPAGLQLTTGGDEPAEPEEVEAGSGGGLFSFGD